MTDKPRDKPTAAPDDAPLNPERRRLLGGIALAGAALTLGSCRSLPGGSAGTQDAAALSRAEMDALLRENIQHVVVLYAENRSFNNLFADYPGLEKPLREMPASAVRQLDRDGTPLTELPPIWGGMVRRDQVLDGRNYKMSEDAITHLPNQPFVLSTADGTPLPHAVVTRDLVHRFYENQLQINGGKNDGFVAWGNTGAMVMGHYADSSENLQLWQLARQYTLCDNFFMGAFGGSFLNHQYLVAARPPFYPQADQSPAKFHLATLQDDDPTGTHPLMADDSPASAMQGRARFATPTSLTPDFWAVNTFGPPYAPAFTRDRANPQLADPADSYTLPPQNHLTIGDTLSAKGIDWAWYAGAWQAALDGHGGEEADQGPPSSPNFQPHHQPLNYFKQFAPGTAARAEHLRDAGVGSDAQSNRLLASIAAGTLPQVTFYKPQGDLNMHAGYSSVEAGDRHLATVVEALQKSPQWPYTLVIVTVDENGGWWDHVAPPKGDRWGPGTRIPALLLSPHVKRGFVDHTIYDTGSIARFLTRRFGLAQLPGIKLRDEAMIAAGGPPPGDLTAALQF